MFDNSLRLAKDHGGLLAAGFFLFFFSVFGQSAFFGVYLPFIQEELDLTKTGVGSIYAMATIASAIPITSAVTTKTAKGRHSAANTTAVQPLNAATLAAL